VTKPGRGSDDFDDSLLALFAAIASHDDAGFERILDHTPGLITFPLRVGASRQDPLPYFLTPIRHYVYAGDTALHAAAAAHGRGLAKSNESRQSRRKSTGLEVELPEPLVEVNV
jgi:hypothetical protein